MEFGDYELLEELGRGGQGVVYRARQKSLNRTVALKVIGLGPWSAEMHIKRFRQEAEAAASLEHPCIVPIYEIGERDGSCYFSMKFVEGGELDEVVRREPMSTRRAAELLVKVACTVHYAHEHGVLHRDIKPGNILLDRHGEPHLTDFGLARLIEQESTVTNSFDVLGTPSYMAPEQAAGHGKELTAAADVYALGAVFYQMLTGQPPFAGGTTYETIRLVMETEPRKPRLWNSKIDRDLETICLKCLEKDSQKRYASALELAEDLEHWLRHEPIRARRSGVFSRGRKWVRRNPTTAVLVPILVALMIVLGAMLWKSAVERLPVSGIAVLPFENLGDDKENASFADGIQDDILTKLAKVADLKVISRTSVMQYRGERNTRKIGQALRVTHVLEGSVRKAGDRVHLNAQLIDTRNDAHVWAEQYDRPLTDIFSIQTDVAQRIAEQLRAKVSTQEKVAIREKPTNDLRAYQLYSEARAILVWNDPEGAERSVTRQVKLLEQATQRDPDFALAYCALAKAEDDFYDISVRDSRHLELAKKAADTALRLRPDLAEAHREMGRYYFYVEDYDRASQELTIARRTLPNDSEALRVAGQIDRQRNRWDASLDNLRKANELDPRNGEIIHHLRWTYHLMRLYDEEKQFLDRSAFAQPEYPAWFSIYMAEIKLDQGDPAGAKAILAELPLEFSPTLQVWAARFNAALYVRDYEEASRVIAATPPKFAVHLFAGQSPHSWADGMIARIQGDEQKAQVAFADARESAEAAWASKAKDDFYFREIARIDAGLGRKEEAIREAQRAVELMPISKDSLRGPGYVRNLALIYALTGERNLAIEQLEIVVKIPAGPSYGELRFNPVWDPLRDDPRFEKLLAESAKPIPLQ
jgi:TolB-like protein/predicted Ser/Thr protein kinase/Tfp pilus assembly protein PilF